LLRANSEKSVITPSDVVIQVNPALTADQLFIFYQRNNICEVGFGKEMAAQILKHPHLIVAAFAGDEMIGIARATFDGLSAHIMEFSIDLRYQGDSPRYTNGSLIEADREGVGRQPVIPLVIGLLQPDECLIYFSESGVNSGDVIRHNIMSPGMPDAIFSSLQPGASQQIRILLPTRKLSKFGPSWSRTRTAVPVVLSADAT
jgi:hypothetical protein